MRDEGHSRLYHDGYLSVMSGQDYTKAWQQHTEYRSGVTDATQDAKAFASDDRAALLRTADRLWLLARTAKPEFFRPRYMRIFVDHLPQLTAGMRDVADGKVNHDGSKGLRSRPVPIGS